MNPKQALAALEATSSYQLAPVADGLELPEAHAETLDLITQSGELTRYAQHGIKFVAAQSCHEGMKQALRLVIKQALFAGLKAGIAYREAIELEALVKGA